MHATLRAPELSATSRTDSCWIIAVLPSDRRRPRQGGLDLPALALRDGPVFDDLDAIADRAGILLVVRHELREAAHVLLVLRILHEPLHAHHDGLVHLVADDRSHQGSPHAAFLHFAPRLSRRIVSARAMSRRSVRSFAV